MMVDITMKKFKMEEPHSESPNILEYRTAKTGLQTTKLFFTENGKSKNGSEMRRCKESCHDVCSLPHYRSAVSKMHKSFRSPDVDKAEIETDDIPVFLAESHRKYLMDSHTQQCIS